MKDTDIVHILMQFKEKDGLKSMYPINSAIDVTVDPSVNSTLSESDIDLNEIIKKLGKMAFNNGDNVVYVGESEESDVPEAISEINDNVVENETTWSSAKISDSLKYKSLGILVTVGSLNKDNIKLPTSYNELLVYSIINSKRVTHNIAAEFADGNYVASYYTSPEDYGSLTFTINLGYIFIKEMTYCGEAVSGNAISVYYK